MKIIGYLVAGIVGLVALISILNFFGLAELTKSPKHNIEDKED
jgi:hypothetical protein